MQKRQEMLLNTLINRQEVFSQTSELADQLDCSPRTLRNDINSVSEKLVENGFPPIERVRGVGVRLNLESEERVRVRQWLLKQTEHSPVKSDKERRLFILYQLLMEKKSLTLDYFASQYYVSAPIIRQDLEALVPLCEKYDVSIHTVKRAGTTIKGTETNKRALLSYTVKQLGEVQSPEKNLLQFFDPSEITIVTETLKAIQKNYGLLFSPKSFEGLRLHALFTIKRLYLNQPVVVPEEKQQTIRDTRYYEWSHAFAERVEKALAIRFPENERAYLALHFQNVRLNKTSDETYARPEWVDDLVEFLIKEVTELTGYALHEENTLKDNLILHLENTASRLENNFIISNPLLNEIKKEYVYLFHFVQQAVENFFEGEPFLLPEEEIGYLTVHFQAAIERYKNEQPQQVKVGVVCHYGVGVSAFIQARIESRFPDIHETVLLAESEVSSAIDEHGLSLILSTVPLSDQLPVAALDISPLLNEAELDTISHLLKDVGEKSGSQESESWSLLNYSQPFLIHLQEEFSQAEEVLLFMAEELERRGYVKEGYADTVLEREERASTSIGKGIALPHGKPALIQSSVISCVTLKEPIKWGNDEVSLIFLFALQKEELKNKEAKGFFKFVQKIMGDKEQLKQLKEEEDVLTFLNYASIQKS